MNKVVTVVDDGKTKRSKAQAGVNKKKKVGGVKVVYISNPVKINTSASEFRALVQQLTGQHSPPPYYYQSHRHGSAPPPAPLLLQSSSKLLHHHNNTNNKEEEEDDDDDDIDDDDVEQVLPSSTNIGGASSHDESAAASGSSSDLYYYGDDGDVEDVFMPQMEKFSSFWYESTHLLDHQLKRLDASLL